MNTEPELVFERGSMTVVTGPSPAETTRRLETVTGLENNKRTNENQDLKTGYVDTNAPLLSTFNVRMNVMLPRLYHCGETHEDAAAYADALLDRLGYEGARDESPARLSAFENVQVLLARALALDPPRIFIDEPFYIEIITAWTQLAQTLRVLAREENRAVVVATRNLAFASAYADQLVFIHEDKTSVYRSWREFANADAPSAFIGALPFAVEHAQ